MLRHPLALAALAAGYLVIPSPCTATTITLQARFVGTSPGLNTPWMPVEALAPGLNYSGFVRGSGAVGRSANDVFAFNITAGSTESSLPEAIQDNEFVGLTLSSLPSQTMDLRRREVAFSIQRRSWHAPRRYAVLSSLSGFTSSSEPLFVTPRIESGDNNEYAFRFFLPDDPSWNELTQPVEFRLYAYEANFNHETWLTAWSISEFDGPVYRLTTVAAPGGEIFPASGTRLLRGGDRVSLRALPHPGQRFGGWTGDVPPGRSATRTLIMSQDATVTALFEPVPARLMAVGMNLDGVTDWATSWPFTDWFKRMRRWQTRNADGSGGWSTNLHSQIPVDSHFWVTQVPFTPASGPPQIVHTIMTHIPTTGTIRLSWQGAGRFRIGTPGQAAQWFTTTGGQHQTQLPISTTNGTIFLEIHETSGSDYLRNFRMESPGFWDLTENQPFHPLFLERLGTFRGLRFMDWQSTNASPLASWNNRTTSATSVQTRPEGVALEYMVQLSNTLQQDAWICIPHQADDHYVRQTARLVRDQLQPHLRVLVEYSNETWNFAGPFTQTVWVQDRGQALGLSSDRWEAGQRFTSLRSAEIWRIFEEEFTGAHRQRLVKVLATQSGNINITTQRLAYLNDLTLNPTQTHPDALAIAPYFGPTFSPQSIANNGYPTVDHLVTTTSIQYINVNARNQVRAHRELADAQGWDLICYEGGQHLVGVNGAENDTTLTELLIAANRDPRMGERYTEYLTMLREEGVREFYNFAYVAPPSRWGSWGNLEYQNQPLEEAHKMRATLQWIQDFPVPVSMSQWEVD